MEPRTIEELETALARVKFQIVENGDGELVAVNNYGSEQTILEADNYGDALFEAWNLLKP